MGPVLYEHGLELHPDHKLRFRLSAQVIAIWQRGIPVSSDLQDLT